MAEFNCDKSFRKVLGELCTVGQIVLRGTRIIIPAALRPQVLRIAHEGHLGIVGTKQRLRTKVWWPGLDKDIDQHCKACYGCQLVAQYDPPEPIRSTPLLAGPWKELAVDLMRPLPTRETLLVLVDYHSRFYELAILRSTTSEKIIESLDKIFCRFSYPMTLKIRQWTSVHIRGLPNLFREYQRKGGLKPMVKWRDKITPF